MNQNIYLYDTKILILEDDGMLQNRILANLEELGNEVAFISSGMSVVDEYKSFKPDIFVINQDINDTIDLENMEYLLKHCASTPSILLTTVAKKSFTNICCA